jgi:hypothetical protein
METAPSPKKQRVTRPSPRYFDANAVPAASGMCAADDAVAAEHVVLDVEQVHRAAEALRAAGLFAEELGHHAFALMPARARCRDRGRW